MSWKQLAGKGTWLGTATAAVVLLAVNMLERKNVRRKREAD